VDLRQVRVREDVGQDLPLAALARLDLPVGLADPAAFPLLLVLPFARIADARLGLHVVEPGVFHPRPGGPDVLAGDRAGVAPDALVEVQDHADLGAYFHFPAPCSVAASGSSIQSTFAILRTTTNSSRFAPTVP